MIKLTAGMMLFLLVIFMGSMGAGAEEPFMTVPLHAKPTGTYYLEVSFNGAVHNDLMLDTGSEFLVINETTLRSLHHDRRVTYRHDISGVLADGSTVKVPVYHLSSLKIGCCCVVRDMDAAVFPGNTREILGLTVLRKVAPFSVSLDPAKLTLSNCGDSPAERLSTAFPGNSPIDTRKPGNPADIAGIEGK